MEEQNNSRTELGTIKWQNFDFLGLSIETYNDHIEVKPVLRDVMLIQELGNMPAVDNEMAIEDGMVAMARSLNGKLQWMTTLLRANLSKKLNDALSLLNTRTTWGVVRALSIVVRLYKRRPIPAMKFRKLIGILQMEFYGDASQKHR